MKISHHSTALLACSLLFCFKTHLCLQALESIFLSLKPTENAFQFDLRNIKSALLEPFSIPLKETHSERSRMICEWNLILLVQFSWFSGHCVKKKGKKVLEEFSHPSQVLFGGSVDSKDDNSIIFSDAPQLFTRNFFPFLFSHKSILSDAIIPYEKAASKRVSKIFENHSAMKKKERENFQLHKSFSSNAFENHDGKAQIMFWLLWSNPLTIRLFIALYRTHIEIDFRQNFGFSCGRKISQF